MNSPNQSEDSATDWPIASCLAVRTRILPKQKKSIVIDWLKLPLVEAWPRWGAVLLVWLERNQEPSFLCGAFNSEEFHQSLTARKARVFFWFVLLRGRWRGWGMPISRSELWKKILPFHRSELLSTSALITISVTAEGHEASPSVQRILSSASCLW